MSNVPMVRPGKYDHSGGIVFNKPEVVLGIEYHPLAKVFKRGDIFLSTNPMLLGKIINRVSSLYSPDRNSEFSHSGLFLDPLTIVEASYRVSQAQFIEKYENDKVLVGRHNEMTDITFTSGIGKIEQHYGDIYPFHRLFLHIFNLAQFIHWNNVVCSELVSKFLFGAGLRSYNYYGVTPDHLADEIINSLNKQRTGPQYEIIYNDVLPVNIYKKCTVCDVNVFTAADEKTCPICLTKRSLFEGNVVLPELLKYNKSKAR